MNKRMPLSADKVKKLQARVAELEQTLNFIRSGEVDALILNNKQGLATVFTIEGADAPYRMLIESLSEGALTLSAEGTLIHCNQRFAEMVNCPLPDVIGRSFYDFFPANQRKALQKLLVEGKERPCTLEIKVKRSKNPVKAVLLSCHKLSLGADDFGTGYSSLSYLKQLPIKEVKIDKSFIDDIGTDQNNEAIIQLATTLNLEVVAEGVETKAQLEFLTKNHCRIIQDFYDSKPLTAADMLTYIAQF